MRRTKLKRTKESNAQASAAVSNRNIYLYARKAATAALYSTGTMFSIGVVS